MPLSSQAERGGLTDPCARPGDEGNPHPRPKVIAKENARAIAVPCMVILLVDTGGWQNLCLAAMEHTHPIDPFLQACVDAKADTVTPAKPESTGHEFEATTTSGTVTALLTRPAGADCLLVFAHGAGAGMRHEFMETLTARLANNRIAVFRYQFPYMEQGLRRPDFQPVLLKTVRSAIAAAGALSDGLPVFAGGKSMGGRMTSLAAAKEPLSGVQGIIFFGFPLHPAQKPGVERSQHLRAVGVPLLFLQGTRDKLAPLDLLGPVCQDLPQPTTLQIIEGADHGFHVLKRSGRSADEVHDELADATRKWLDGLIS
jgi:predicted alpha/beta-hydrolase family hydrolase